MKLNLKNTRLLNYFFFSLATALVSLIVCLFELKYIASEELSNENEHYRSHLLAERLRQSSDDLTAMARLYVNTGDKKYRDYYNEIIAIRDGNAPRPVNYDGPFWSLAIANKIHPLYNPPKSLIKMMMEHHFTMKEFSLLLDAESKSNHLSQIEVKAMNMVEEKKDKDSVNYTLQGTMPQLAQHMLFSNHYVEEKSQVMNPIQEFFMEVDTHAKKISDELDARMIHIIIISISLAILSTILMVFTLWQTLVSLSKANEKNDILLLNIMPEAIARRLKSGEKNIADEYPFASVLFADIIDFTTLTEKMGPQRTVTILNQLFAEFDNLTELYQIEKVKTIGDNYMAVSGIPIETTEHATNMANYALAILERMKAFNQKHQLNLRFRIGMTYGPVIAGVIGHKKFHYDVWGNVVNLASRLEKSALPNKIHISEQMAFMLRERYYIEPFKKTRIKGFGQINTFILLGKKELKSDGKQIQIN